LEWYKHDTSATQDAKIRKLLIYSERVTGSGVYGYAIYFHCLELIAGDFNAGNITFELEHDAEIIADTLRIQGTSEKSGREIVEELMRYMIDLGLFENESGRITCTKMLKRLDTSMTSNIKLRKIINAAKEHHDTVMIPSCKNRIEENRREEKRTEKTTPPAAVKPQKAVTVSSQDTELYNQVKDVFLQECKTFKSWAKEGSAIKGLIKDARIRSPDDPYGWIMGMIETFRYMRERDKFFKSQPFVPSSLNSAAIYERVVDYARQRWEAEQRVDDTEGVAF
jgi:hypothetical protein